MSRRHEDLKPLAEVIRAFRRATGHTQEGFAYDAKLDRGFVGAVERAERNVGFRLLRRYLVGLRATWRDFGTALHEIDPLWARSPAERDAAVVQLRETSARQRAASLDLRRALVRRMTEDQQFAVLAANEAAELLPCKITKQLERIAHGAALDSLCDKLARDRRLLDLLFDSRTFREAAVRHVDIAACMAEYSAARTVANSAGKHLRKNFEPERRDHA